MLYEPDQFDRLIDEPWVRAHVEGADVDAVTARQLQHRARVLEADIRFQEPSRLEMPVEREVTAAEFQHVARCSDDVGDQRIARSVIRPVPDARREPVERGGVVDRHHGQSGRACMVRRIVAYREH